MNVDALLWLQTRVSGLQATGIWERDILNTRSFFHYIGLMVKDSLSSTLYSVCLCKHFCIFLSLNLFSWLSVLRRPISHITHIPPSITLLAHTLQKTHRSVSDHGLCNETQAPGSACAYCDLHCYWSCVVLYECQCVTYLHSTQYTVQPRCFSPLLGPVLPGPPLSVSAHTCSFLPLRVSQPISITPRTVSGTERWKEGGREGGRGWWWIKSRRDGRRDRLRRERGDGWRSRTGIKERQMKRDERREGQVGRREGTNWW